MTINENRILADWLYGGTFLRLADDLADHGKRTEAHDLKLHDADWGAEASALAAEGRGMVGAGALPVPDFDLDEIENCKLMDKLLTRWKLVFVTRKNWGIILLVNSGWEYIGFSRRNSVCIAVLDIIKQDFWLSTVH